MNLDHIAIVIRFDKKLDDNNNVVWEETYLKEFIYYGYGAARDSESCKKKCDELNLRHKTSERYYSPVRIDVDKAIKLGLLVL